MRALLSAVVLLVAAACGGGEAPPADPCSAQADPRFRPQGEIGAKDFTVAYDGERFHILHIREKGPWMGRRVERRLGHEVSDDLVQWTAREPVELLGRKGSWKDRHIWAPHLLRRGERWWLYYTGVTYERDAPRNLQRIGLAFSDDLERWEDAPSTVPGVEGAGCVLEGGAAWTAWGRDRDWSGDCRDPFVLPHEGGWIMFLSVRLLDHRMAVARAASPDGLHWKLIGPVEITRGRRAESPAAAVAGGTWHLVWSGESGVQHATAPGPDGPWTARGVVHGGFAPDLLPLADGQALYGWVDGTFSVRWRRLSWQSMELSPVVSPRCDEGVHLQGPAPAYGSSQESAGP